MSMYTGHVSAPNPHYECEKCGRDLWSKYKRLRNPGAAPTIFITLDDKMLCQRCFCKDRGKKEQSLGDGLPIPQKEEQ